MSDVAIPNLFFAERAVDPAGDRIADPDDGSQENDGQRKLQGNSHVVLRDFPLATTN
jgi:hypothetical protein